MQNITFCWFRSKIVQKWSETVFRRPFYFFKRQCYSCGIRFIYFFPPSAYFCTSRVARLPLWIKNQVLLNIFCKPRWDVVCLCPSVWNTYRFKGVMNPKKFLVPYFFLSNLLTSLLAFLGGANSVRAVVVW